MRHYLQLTTLSPLHIGSGEDFVPTAYIIDGDTLYEFDETDFFHALSAAQKRAFENMAGQGLYALKRFYDIEKDLAKSIAYRKLPVSREISKIYTRQFNKDGTLNKNLLEISKTMTMPGSFLSYIPGSSIKGVFGTALGIYPGRVGNDVRQNLLVEDFFPTQADVTFCDVAERRHKFKDAPGRGIPIKIEIIKEGVSFFGSILSERRGESKQLFSIEDIARSLERFDMQADEKMFAKYKRRADALGADFLFRVGRFAGKNFTSVNPDKIPVTHTVIASKEGGYTPFGWVAAKILDEEGYREASAEYERVLRELIKKRTAYAKEWRESRIQKEKERNEKELKMRREEEEKAERKRAEAQRLASLSPVERLIETVEIPELIRKMQNGEIENYESIKVELAQKIKAKLLENPKTWEKAKQKALKRRVFIESILGE
ncbi:CRISPR-associated protein, Csm5 family [Hydrogenimonas sp.]|nr:CRISPR-associated protein, Csm5 family [Hydrogenimonas sp.]